MGKLLLSGYTVRGDPLVPAGRPTWVRDELEAVYESERLLWEKDLALSFGRGRVEGQVSIDHGTWPGRERMKLAGVPLCSWKADDRDRRR
jgi:hypothetical protein